MGAQALAEAAVRAAWAPRRWRQTRCVWHERSGADGGRVACGVDAQASAEAAVHRRGRPGTGGRRGACGMSAQARMEAVVRAAWTRRRWRRPRCGQRKRPGTGRAGSGAKKVLCQEALV